MTPEKWQRIESLFHSALDRQPHERAAFLNRACGLDSELRGEVIKLLNSFDEAGEFIEQPLLENSFPAKPAAHPEALIGRKIGNYEILSLLGVGGMGEVYLARDDRLDRQIALKLLPAQFTGDAEQVQRFEREARAASALNHPNIITIYEIGQDGDEHFIATEFVAGEMLRQKISRGKIELREALNIAAQLASALEAAHSAGIIHRDIKPENIMVRPDGLVKLLDFGLAKPPEERQRDGETERRRDGEVTNEKCSLSLNPSLPLSTRLSMPGTMMGTLAYLSPEQARGEKADHRTDIFSLGVVLYEMIEGVRPFSGDTSTAILSSILSNEPFPVGAEIARLPNKLTEIIHRALAKDRNSRYQQAEEMGAELRRFARKFEPASGIVSDVVIPNEKPARGRWLMKTAAGLGILLAGLVAWRLLDSATNPTPSPWSRAKATRLTGYRGEEFTPVLSPDGQSIIFMHKDGEDYDICWQRLNEASFKNLTPDCDLSDIQPAFSPDGSQIAFRSDCNGGGIFVMPVTGGTSRQVSDIGYNPAWSPDGKEILYSTGNAFSPHVRRTAGGQLWAVRADTGEKRHLQTTDAMQPAYSPHGSRIVYWGVNPNDQHQRDIWTIAAQGGQSVAVTNDAALDWNPVWSPDGHIYFVSNRTGIMNLWRVPLEEATGKVLGPPEAVTGPSSETWNPSISRDGKRLVYVQRTVRGTLETIPFDPETGNVTGKPLALTQGAVRLGFLDLSPDGEWLAYYNFGDTQEDIFVIKRDGSQVFPITNDKCKDRMPRWSPDGKQIAFYSDCGGSDQIWVVNRETKQRRQITFQPGAGAQYPVWSPDGSRLTYHSRGVGTFILDMEKPWQEQTHVSLKPMKQAGQSFIAWSWSSDGRQLAGVRATADDDFPGIWVYEIESGQYSQITKIGAYPMWLPVGLTAHRWLFFSDERKLYLADARSVSERVVLNFAPDEVNYGLPSRDARHIYYTVRSAESDIHELSLP